mgnify:CR=1 FL=1
MDLNDYWQENKNFVLCVAAGFLVFFIGNGLIQSNIGADVTAARGRINSTQRELGKITLTKADLREAERENEELRAAVEGMLDPEEVEETVGEAQVKELFRSSKAGTIAGCTVTEGKIRPGAQLRLVRERCARRARND